VRDRVQAGDRLVQQQQVGVVGQRQHDGQLLLVAQRQRIGPLAQRQVQPARQRNGIGHVHARVDSGHLLQVIQAGEAGEEVRRLGGIAQALAHGIGQRQAGFAQQPRLALGGRGQAEQAAHQRALACTVAAHEPDDGALGYGKVYALQQARAGRAPLGAIAIEAELPRFDGGAGVDGVHG
jgi:hypothetical protein